MGKEYNHLGYEDRCRIEAHLDQGMSKRAIARLLGRSHSTIVREINRNRGAFGYGPKTAQGAARRRHTCPRKKLVHHLGGWEQVQELLAKGWSPEQIAGTLKRMHPDDKTLCVSHETIYAHISMRIRVEACVPA